jgi:hypothetical protein
MSRPEVGVEMTYGETYPVRLPGHGLKLTWLRRTFPLDQVPDFVVGHEF